MQLLHQGEDSIAWRDFKKVGCDLATAEEGRRNGGFAFLRKTHPRPG